MDKIVLLCLVSEAIEITHRNVNLSGVNPPPMGVEGQNLRQEPGTLVKSCE
jgi:hypothetical protein